MQRIFVTKDENGFVISESDRYHLEKVLRIKNGDQIECVYNDQIFLCEYQIFINNYNLKIIEEKNNDCELNIKVSLYQALIRNENFELVVQKATELGVSDIYPTVFKRNVVVIEPKKENAKIERFNKISASASMQSHRIKIPVVHNQINVNNIELESGQIGLVCYEKENDVKSLMNIEKNILMAKEIKVVIGPEGGFEEKEYQTLINKGFISVSLGKRILRSETAALNILSKLTYIIEKE